VDTIKLRLYAGLFLGILLMVCVAETAFNMKAGIPYAASAANGNGIMSPTVNADQDAMTPLATPATMSPTVSSCPTGYLWHGGQCYGPFTEDDGVQGGVACAAWLANQCGTKSIGDTEPDCEFSGRNFKLVANDVTLAYDGNTYSNTWFSGTSFGIPLCIWDWTNCNDGACGKYYLAYDFWGGAGVGDLIVGASSYQGGWVSSSPVQAYSTTTSVSCSPNPSIASSGTYPQVTCTATVSGAASSITGSVTWSLPSGSSWNFIPASNDQCTLSESSPYQCSVTVEASSTGSTTITAGYGGDSNNKYGSGIQTLYSLPEACAPQTFTSSTQFVTSGSDFVSGGAQEVNGAPSLTNTPVISDVLQSNAGNAGWLITCPLAPNTVNTVEYFTIDPSGFTMGDTCLAPPAQDLTTTVYFNLSMSCSSTTLANSIPYFAFHDLAVGNAYSLAYSGTTNYMDRGVNDISNGYDTETYIFGQVPPSTQYGLWTWSADFADLSRINNEGEACTQLANGEYTCTQNPVDYLSFSEMSESAYLGPLTESCGSSSTVDCDYPYVYNVIANVVSITPTTIPVPSNTPYGGYVSIPSGPGAQAPLPDSVLYPYTEWDNFVSNKCADDLVQMCSGAYAGTIALGSTHSSDCSGTFTLVANDVSLHTNGGVSSCITQDNVGASGNGCVSENGFYDGGMCLWTWDQHAGEDFLMSHYDTGDWGFWQCDAWHGCSFKGGYVPSTPSGGQPSSQFYMNLGALPYLLYNLSMPSQYSTASNRQQTLNLTLDLYSEQNYLNPGADSMGAVPLSTGSGLFANETSADPTSFPPLLSLYPGGLTAPSSDASDLQVLPSYSFVSSLKDSDLAFLLQNAFGISGDSLASSSGTIGDYEQFSMQDPVSIAETPDDYVYVLTHRPLGEGEYGAASYLFGMRFIPAGYFNVTSDSPAGISTDPADWSTQWENYWSRSFEEQASSLYVTYFVPLGCYAGDTWFWLFGDYWEALPCSYQSTMMSNPLAVAADYASDIFIAGTSSLNYPDTSDFNVMEISSTPQAPMITDDAVGYEMNLQSYPLNPQGAYFLSDDFAASPSGQEVYVAYPSDGGFVYVFSTPTSSGGAGIFQQIQLIDLDYSNQTYNLDMGAYLANGGPFDDPAVSSLYAAAQDTYDVSSNHHPVALSDVGGILYVLDNWTFTVVSPGIPCTGCRTPAVSSILMLRAFNGSREIPVDGSAISYSKAVNNEEPLLTTGFSNPTSWPPFGWPLSAAIGKSDVPSSQGTNCGIGMGNPPCQTGNWITYCADGCTDVPGILPSGYPANPADADTYNAYPPIGPEITITYARAPRIATPFGFTVDFNNTAYLVANVPDTKIGTAASATTATTYLGVFKLAFVNYTKISLGSYAPHTCYVSNWKSPSPCSSVTSANFIEMSAPVIGMPSAFSYDESQGSSAIYSQSVGLTGIPGLTAISPAAQNQANTAASEEGSSGTITTIGMSGNINTLQNSYTGLSSLAPASSVPSFTYINSIISEGLVVPYCAEYKISQTWTLGTAAPSPQSCTCSEYPPDTTWPGTSTDISATSCTITSDISYCGSSLAPLQSSSLNDTVEGGSTYIQAIPSKTYYTPNLSDASSIVQPYLNYDLFTSRIFGEAYTNLTVNPTDYSYYSNPSPIPDVINAIQTYQYQLITVNQVYGGVTYPEYSYQLAVPVPNNGLVGVNCLSYTASPANPADCYYDPLNYFMGQSALDYAAAAQTGTVSLLSMYVQTSQLDSMVLDLGSDQNMLGYNRLIYTFIDPFNNIIYAPIDTDLAQTTQITLNPYLTVNILNVNETNVIVYGTATLTNSQGEVQPLAYNDIYIYYDTDLNYYDTVNTLTVGTSNYAPFSYYWDSLMCAFFPGTRPSTSCQLTDPLDTLFQADNNGETLSNEVSNVMYEPNFNSIGQCAMLPPSMLVAANLQTDCNALADNTLSVNVVYGGAMAGAYQYCLPTHPDGTGIFTSQLGLVNVVQTDGNGDFNVAFDACGNGEETVIAKYFGGPPPQPVTITQNLLTQSAGIDEFLPVPSSETSQEYNYIIGPYTTEYQISIGAFALSFGNLDTVAVLAFVIAIVALARRGSSK
jgi:hypothetical protein